MKGAIVYVSSNREDPDFEDRIVVDLFQKKGDLVVYSVTQKKQFLCDTQVVGDVGTSGFNFCRQLQLAVLAADADYVISCEADCLYPPEYFTFVPPRLDRVYRNTNNYIIPYKQNVYQRKDSQTAFQVAGREFLLERLNYLLYGHPKWNTEMKNFPKEIGKKFLDSWDTFKTDSACLSIKTGNGMRNHTKTDREDVYVLPYWGSANQVRKKYENN